MALLARRTVEHGTVDRSPSTNLCPLSVYQRGEAAAWRCLHKREGERERAMVGSD